MSDRRGQAYDLDDTFDAYWDALLTSPKSPPDDDFDPGLAATAQRVHALDAAPAPHPVFASTLWEELMSAHATSPPLTAQMGSSLPVRPLAGLAGWLPRRPPPLSGLAAAILLFALLAGIAFTALYPLRQWDSEGLPLVAPLGTPTAEPEAEGEQTLLNLTLDDIPPYLAEGGMSVSRYPPGGSSREFTPEATEVFYIAVGPLTMSVVEAIEPVRVIPAHEPGTASPAATHGAGDEATLETGATLIAPPGTILDLVNAGTTSTTMLDLLWASTSYSVEDGGATWERASGWMSQDLVLPVSFLLRQVTLDAGEALPPSVSRDAAQAVVSVDPARSANILGHTNGSATNVGDEPLEAYVMIVYNDTGASLLTTPRLATPPTSTAASPAALVDFTLSDIEPFTAEGGIAVTDYPPGGSSRELAGRESPEIFYVATGPMAMSVEAAPQPVRVMPPRGTNTPVAEQSLNQGAEATLETGTLVYLPEKAIVNLLNPGSDPTRMMDLLWATESYSTEADGARWVRVSLPDPHDIVSPTRITLRQSTLAADERVPSSSTESEAVSTAAVEEEHRWQIRLSQEGEPRNDAGESIDVYVLRVESGYEAPAPGANVENPDAAAIEFLWKSDGDPEDGFSLPYGLGIDPQGNLWVSDAANDRFQILAPDGTHLETWGSPGVAEGEFEFFSPNSGFGAPYGDVAFDPDGNIYVADTGNFRVQKFAPDRSFLLEWGEEGEGDGQFLAPSSIAIGHDGTVHVSDEERADVQMFDADGQFLGVTAQAPDDGLVYMPAGIAVDGDGAIWVADYLGHRILSFSPDGDLLSSWGERGIRSGQFVSPNDVAVDDEGQVFVADDGNNRLQAFTADGEFLDKIGGIGGNNGIVFGDAVGVAVSSDGIVYVTDDASIQAFHFTRPDAE